MSFEQSLLDENLEKYEVLKKRRDTEKSKKVKVGQAKCSLDMEALIAEVFSHPSFRQALSYLYPEMIQLPIWNPDDRKTWLGFCNGLFDFDIPQYKEALPLRLASYFYPDKFLPIFKLANLKKVCDALGIVTDAESRGERLFAYSSFLEEKLQDIPVNNYIKSDMAYHLLHAIELYEWLKSGMGYCEVMDRYRQNWRKGYIEKGRRTLENLGMVTNT